MKRVTTVVNYLKQNNIKVKEGYEIKGFGEDFEQSRVQSQNRKVLIAYEIKKEESIAPTIDRALSVQFKEAKTGDKIRLKTSIFII